MVSTIVPALLLPGAALLPEDEKGINETYRGALETQTGKTFAYVKLLDAKQLINELVSSVLGRTLGLLMPTAFIVLVSRDDYPDSAFLATHGLDKVLAFGVESVGYPDLKCRMKVSGDLAVEELLRTWAGWCEAMLFDEWIANGDRNAGNVLVGGPGEVWLIDHGNAFTGPNWVPLDLDPSVAVQNEIARVVVPRLGLPDRYRALHRSQAFSVDCGKLDTEEVIKESFVAAFVSQEEIEALRAFIAKRVGELVRLTSVRLGLPVLLILLCL